jgi:hypothetical protein
MNSFGYQISKKGKWPIVCCYSILQIQKLNNFFGPPGVFTAKLLCVARPLLI